MLHKPHASLKLDQPTLSTLIDSSTDIPPYPGGRASSGMVVRRAPTANADPISFDPTDGTISQELAKGSTRPLLEDLKLVCHGADSARACRRGSGGSVEISETARGSQGRAQEGNASPTPQQGRAGGLEAALDLRARAALGTWR